MRRRTSGAGAAARIALLDLDREIIELYGHLMSDGQRERMVETMGRLESGKAVELIVGWQLAGYVPGAKMDGRYRLGADESVTSH